eukprot:CAMPEP_0178995602 /NCGR_PEP_ID=MMETSP0795-20121207/7910_1 /TAXON_ID=88552 /ORGANISM="Amoebophrya sp., Strain Ameob2" /LENGTH=572 /DNA_ID=CAMNT_0020687911 /DNA_START=51 /DNA_END=1769 /DNA_ORIENTATION=-
MSDGAAGTTLIKRVTLADGRDEEAGGAKAAAAPALPVPPQYEAIDQNPAGVGSTGSAGAGDPFFLASSTTSSSAEDEVTAELRSHYTFMCVMFGLVFGGTASSSSLLTAVAGDALGSTCNGLFYATSVFSSLALGVPAVSAHGPLWAIAVGGMLQFFFSLMISAGILLSARHADRESSGSWLEQHASSHSCFLAGAALAGLGMGPFWTGKGVFYANTCEAIAARKHRLQPALTKEQHLNATGTQLGALFGFVFLFFEFLAKLLAGGLMSLYHENEAVVFPVFACTAALAATVLAMRGKDPPHVRSPEDEQTSLQRVTAVLQVFWDAPYVLLASITNIGFGLTVAAVLTYLNVHIVKKGYNNEDRWVAFYSAAPVLTACMFTGVTYWTPVGKNWIPAAIMSFSMAVIPVALWLGLTRTPELESAEGVLRTNPSAWIVYAAQGVARSIFETANRAIFLEIFAGTRFINAAFASIQVTHTSTVALGLFIGAGFADRPLAVRDVLGGGILAMALLLVPGYFVARTRAKADKIPEDEREDLLSGVKFDLERERSRVSRDVSSSGGGGGHQISRRGRK